MRPVAALAALPADVTVTTGRTAMAGRLGVLLTVLFVGLLYLAFLRRFKLEWMGPRATAGWKGRNAAIVALVGLATLWFNFIGINFFSSSSQHSYAAPVVHESTEARL